MMIELQNVTKVYRRGGANVIAVDDICLTIQRGERLGILGENGAGKSTLIKLIGGAELPSEGVVIRNMSVSWPLAMRGGLNSHLSGFANIRFLSRIYDLPFEEMVSIVQAFSGLGIRLADPVSTYSSGMRAKFSFGVSLTVEFDCYLLDEIVAVGDRNLRKKCREELLIKRNDRAIVLVAHQANIIEEYCSRCVLLENGRVVDSFDISNTRGWRKYV